MDSHTAHQQSLMNEASLVRHENSQKSHDENKSIEHEPIPQESADPATGQIGPTHSSARPSNSNIRHHGRTMSVATGSTTQVPNRSNRFSMTFPVLPPSTDPSPVRRSISPTRDSVATPAPPLTLVTTPSDGNFLTAIAAHERRVLELREELHKAETDLAKLKLQWASHEAQNKDGTQKVTKPRPISIAVPGNHEIEDAGESNASWQQEVERRRAMLAGIRTSNRTVFSGSRHTRALSLLSPVHKGDRQSALDRLSGVDSVPEQRSPETTQAPLGKPPSISRASTTMPDLNAEIAKKTDLRLDLANPGIDRDMLLNQGKKMALEFRDGLWTFFEDLRQATVGEEATQVPPSIIRSKSSSHALRTPRRGGSRNSIHGPSRGSSDARSAGPRSPLGTRSSPKKIVEDEPDREVDGSPWAVESLLSASGSPNTATADTGHAKAPSMAGSVASSDAWDNWDDSPQASRTSSATSNTTSRPSTNSGSQETSPNNGNSLSGQSVSVVPWPALSTVNLHKMQRGAKSAAV